MKGLIFDLVGVVVDSTPVRYNPRMLAFDEAVNIEVGERINYLLEGLRRIESVINIFELNTFGLQQFDESVATQVTKRENDLRKIFSFKSYERVNKLVTNLVIRTVKKAFQTVLEQALGFGEEQFRVRITLDQVKKGSSLNTEEFKLLMSEERIVKHTGSAVDFL